ncbi:tetratricopeptide repeat protein [Desulfobacula sp.]|uniref:tetratricopeptide repeat protein n=1 Tax=Desulfobacula sp. TaxID=2593537 RepID=UPI0025C01311|nr:tetratricopeptide repeat protein [Desulfobacula sp.]MBC2705449.1 tetratricopeptide repeat protein [Desulfobacula sp.]
MMFKRRHTLLFILGVMCFFLVGCTTKYGGIPQVRYTEPPVPIQKSKVPEPEIEIGADEYEKLGDAMLSNGKYFMAFMQYENSLKKNPENLRVEYKKGLALLGGGRHDEAQKIFQLILQKNPDFAPAREGLARANFKNKLYHIAKVNFEKAIALDPLLWRSYGYLGNLHDLAGDYDPAIKEYKTALTLKPDAGFIHNNLGVSFYRSGRYKEAVDSFYQALRLKYDNHKVYNNLGRVLVKLELYDKAFEAFKKGGPEAVAYNNIGVGYLNNEKFDTAAEYFTKAIELSPRFYVLANENLKKCRLKQKQ